MRAKIGIPPTLSAALKESTYIQLPGVLLVKGLPSPHLSIMLPAEETQAPGATDALLRPKA